jgi:hypothetical protein
LIKTDLVNHPQSQIALNLQPKNLKVNWHTITSTEGKDTKLPT